MIFTDRAKPSKRSKTKEGYLVVTDNKFARTGTQVYLASELGSDFSDLPANQAVTIYRPPAEVFDSVAMQSFQHQLVVDDHPSIDKGFVTADNAKKLSVGFAFGDIRKNGDFIEGDIRITDSDMISLIEDGKAELSMGYESDIVRTKGSTQGGIKYDGIMKNIRGNHIAVVEHGRAGNARISDSNNNNQGDTMLIVDGKEFTELNALHTFMADKAEKDMEEFGKKKEEEKEELKADMEAEKKKAADMEAEKEKLKKDMEEEEGKSAKMKADYDALLEKVNAQEKSALADSLSAKGLTVDSSKSLIEMKKTALTDSKVDVEGKSDEQISAFFDGFFATQKKTDYTGVFGDKAPVTDCATLNPIEQARNNMFNK